MVASMKGARLIVKGCTGFWTTYPDEGELHVIDIQHYRVKCTNPKGETMWIPLREFEVLDFPKESTDGPPDT
jgi:hypothetical protein